MHMAKYKHWMGLSWGFERRAPSMHPLHVQCVVPYEAHRCLRFRMCCWPLSASMIPHLTRSDRRCPHSSNGVDSSGLDVLLECDAYAGVRERNRYGLPGGSMQQTMNDAGQSRLTCCLRDVWT